MPGLKDWLRKATGDLKSAKLLQHDDDVLDNAVYFTHQCAEKALKTYLIFKQDPIPKTHDLERLLEICTIKDASFINLQDDVLMLNPYGIYSRYPDDRFVIDKAETQEAIAKATKVLRFVEKKINPAENPTKSLFS